MLESVKGLERPALYVLGLAAIFGASSKIDELLRLFLRQDSGEALGPAFARNIDVFGLILHSAGIALAGLAVCYAGAFAAARARGRGVSPSEAFAALARSATCLLVPAGLTLAAVVSLAISPMYPYGLGLAVSLDLEGTFRTLVTLTLVGASAAHAVSLLGRREEEERPSRRRFLSAPVAAAVFALVLFTLATPSEFYQRGAGQGNMFKYLRMASAIAGTGTLDIEKANDDPDASLGTFLSHLPRMGRSFVAEATRLAGKVVSAAAEGHLYVGEMTARTANRSMFRSADGGIYYINAPGPGILLVPAWILDSYLNRAFGWDRQLAVILLWQLIGALLVYEMAVAAREITDSSSSSISSTSSGGTSALVGLALALIVPILFYTFQIYPELPAALLLLHAFRKLVLDPLPSPSAVLFAALALAALPWLHQKYSVVAFVLALYGASRFVHRGRKGTFRIEAGKLVLLAIPLAFSAFSVFVYNHALTGSLSPTATFRAAGRSSFEPLSFPRGLLGLLFDRENGLLVFAPFYLLALVGLPELQRRHPRLLPPFALVAASYVFVIASFPYWPGAVSTMGRYILSILPLFALPLALVVDRARRDGVVAGVAAVLFAGSLAMSFSFVQDLVPSYQPTLFWDRALYSDPTQYLPSFLTDGVLGGKGDRAHYPKLVAELLVVLVLAAWLGDRSAGKRRASEPVPDVGRFAARASRGAGVFLAGLVALGGLLEHFPRNASDAAKPSYRNTERTPSGLEVSVEGEHGFEGEGAWVPGGGESRFLVLSRHSLDTLDLELRTGPEENEVAIVERGGRETELALPPGGPHSRTILLRRPLRFDGPRGERFLYLLRVRSRGGFVPAASGGPPEDRRELGVYVRVR